MRVKLPNNSVVNINKWNVNSISNISNAFQSCSSLQTITLPPIFSIHPDAFVWFNIAKERDKKFNKIINNARPKTE